MSVFPYTLNNQNANVFTSAQIGGISYGHVNVKTYRTWKSSLICVREGQEREG